MVYDLLLCLQRYEVEIYRKWSRPSDFATLIKLGLFVLVLASVAWVGVGSGYG